jgi:hypothetical protein
MTCIGSICSHVETAGGIERRASNTTRLHPANRSRLTSGPQLRMLRPGNLRTIDIQQTIV